MSKYWTEVSSALVKIYPSLTRGRFQWLQQTHSLHLTICQLPNVKPWQTFPRQEQKPNRLWPTLVPFISPFSYRSQTEQLRICWQPVFTPCRGLWGKKSQSKERCSFVRIMGKAHSTRDVPVLYPDTFLEIAMVNSRVVSRSYANNQCYVVESKTDARKWLSWIVIVSWLLLWVLLKLWWVSRWLNIEFRLTKLINYCCQRWNCWYQEPYQFFIMLLLQS